MRWRYTSTRRQLQNPSLSVFLGRLEGRTTGAKGHGASRVWCKKPDSRMFLGSSLGAGRVSVTVFGRNTT